MWLSPLGVLIDTSLPTFRCLSLAYVFVTSAPSSPSCASVRLLPFVQLNE